MENIESQEHIDNKEETQQEVESVINDLVQENLEQENAVEEDTEEKINWRKFREARAKEKEELKAEQERAEQEKRKSQEKDLQIAALTEAITASLSQSQNSTLTKKEQEQIVAELLDEDIPTGGEVKNFLKQYVPSIIKDILQEKETQKQKERDEQDKREIPLILKRQYPDFDEVMTQDNLEYFQYKYREASEAMAMLPDSKDKWSKIYSTVKKLVPLEIRNESKMIDRNMKKPQQSAISGSSNTQSEEVGPGKVLTEAMKKQNYLKLLQEAKG